MKNNNLALAAAAAGATLCGVIASPSLGAVIDPGLYAIGNHNAGEPVPFGLRLDELYNAASYLDIFLFDFEHEQSFMTLEVTSTTLRISGQARGGRWFQTGLVNDQYLGVYTIDFLYDQGLRQATGDDDFVVDALNNINHGTIRTPLGDTINLWDERGGHPFSFRLGDEDHDVGHRGELGASGWGWLNHGDDPAHHIIVGDWLFTVGELIPTPGSAVTMLAALAVLGGRRRR